MKDSARAPGSPADQLAKKPGYRMRPYRPWRAFAGALMIITAAVTSITIYNRVGDRTEVLALSRDVLAGQQLTTSDLEVVSINTDEAVPMVAAADRDAYVGHYAKWRLSAGNLLDPATLQREELVTSGRGKVSVVVPAGEIPDGLREQSRVALYAYIDSGGTRALLAVADATVFAVPPDLRSMIGSADSSGERVPLTVELNPELAPVVRAANYIGLMLIGRDEAVEEILPTVSLGELGSIGSATPGQSPEPEFGATTLPAQQQAEPLPQQSTTRPDGEKASG